MLIKTSGIEYDDRLRKESISINDLGHSIKIIAVEYENKSANKFVYGSIPAQTLYLHSRKIFGRSKGIILKLFEIHSKFAIQVIKNKPDIVWIHEAIHSGFIPFLWIIKKIGFIKKIIWDHHELPSNRVLSNVVYKYLFNRLMIACDIVIVANELRKNVIKNRQCGNIHILHNYPDNYFRNLKKGILPENLKQWLKGKPYILAQGGAFTNRYIFELVQAVMNVNGINLVVVGPYKNTVLDSLFSNYGARLNHKIHFTGFVPQLEMHKYIDNALASAIFYSVSSKNRLYCEPNRLYQAVIRGIPVIVGNNPPMKSFVEYFHCGIVLNSDGNKSEDIKIGIIKMIQNFDTYKNNCNYIGGKINWESQLKTIELIITI